jgi:hypothetical protein
MKKIGWFTKLVYRVSKKCEIGGEFYELEYWYDGRYCYAGDFDTKEEALKALEKREDALSIGKSVML